MDDDGRYDVLGVLGRGATAIVLRARDRRLGREVAMKVLGDAVASQPGAAARFRREAQALAALSHPGIVHVFDFVTATDEAPAYLVSELIDGPTLRRVLDAHGGRLLPEL